MYVCTCIFVCTCIYISERQLIIMIIVITRRQADKVIQLYETMMTRHTTMIVGPTGGGKSVVIKTLVEAQTKLAFITLHLIYVV